MTIPHNACPALKRTAELGGAATRTMKSCALYPLLIVLLFLVPIGHCEEEPQTSPAAQEPPLSRAGLGALEHASKLIAAINLLDWKTVETATPPKSIFLPLLKRDAAAKDWLGIGGYRGYRLEKQSLTLRFAYGSRSSPHEVWFHYTLDGDLFASQGFTILGW